MLSFCLKQKMPPRTKNVPRKNTPEPTLKKLLDRIRPTASTRARKDEKKKAVLEEEYDDEPEQQRQVDHDMVDASISTDDEEQEYDGHGVGDGDDDEDDDGDGVDDEHSDKEGDEDKKSEREAKKLVQKQSAKIWKQIDEMHLLLSSFPGGPTNLSVLPNYATHIAGRVWDTYIDPTLPAEREVLKVYNHVRRLKLNATHKNNYIVKVLADSGLAPLIGCKYSKIDRGWISAFVERWHGETSSFHLPFGEMTITLEDVSCILHIPIRGVFFNVPNPSKKDAAKLLAHELLVSETRACSNRGWH